ncbi:hypothetical protein PRIPAC_74628 [Pristionchus pacificus]|uniref:Peptidase n=1 Tax=Pristionchus pacificus TaxID=54126 RepID=A0A2A6C5K4_PRIPA|nr:hypothetical protein PRIPAC_74628 [Pristionchus pacificus]|eukprot:PDM73396.1 Peptidase [Pristionchus pacificus]
MAKIDASPHIVPLDTPICELDCRAAFQNLSPTERLYAHYFARASFEGSLVVPLQVSPESAGIFVLLYRLFSSEPVEELKSKALAVGLSYQDWHAFLMYAAFFFYNSGNYASFGDRKFILNIPQDRFTQLVASSKAASLFPDLLSTYTSVEKGIFSVDKRSAYLGFNDVGVTTYHSHNVTKADCDLINRYMKEKDEFEGVRIGLEKGDFAEILARVCPLLEKTAEYAVNETQKAVLRKAASRLWIKDANPAVETFCGFMREYRDPAGTRAEFMGIVAAVNRETSKKFARLVAEAEKILPRLPWGGAYEKDTFLRPDFTALDVIACGTSGIVLGWIIPHMYNDIKQNEGFKNLALSNSISAMPKLPVNFVTKEDEKLLHEYTAKSFDVQVGCHELLGHGSGKLFQRNDDGTFNFDRESTVDILTGGKICSWYEPGETWESLFGHLAGGIEECRCEAVGFAHSWARFILLKVVQEAGQGCLTIEETTDSSGAPDLSVRLDAAKIDSVGMPAVREFVKKLQAYKSTANVRAATALFEKYGVDATDLRWRAIVVSRMQPRRFFVQSNTKVTPDGKGVELVTYPETPQGVIQSVVERFSSESIDVLEKSWKADQKYFPDV